MSKKQACEVFTSASVLYTIINMITISSQSKDCLPNFFSPKSLLKGPIGQYLTLKMQYRGFDAVKNLPPFAFERTFPNATEKLFCLGMESQTFIKRGILHLTVVNAPEYLTAFAGYPTLPCPDWNFCQCS